MMDLESSPGITSEPSSPTLAAWHHLTSQFQHSDTLPSLILEQGQPHHNQVATLRPATSSTQNTPLQHDDDGPSKSSGTWVQQKKGDGFQKLGKH